MIVYSTGISTVKQDALLLRQCNLQKRQRISINLLTFNKLISSLKDKI